MKQITPKHKASKSWFGIFSAPNNQENYKAETNEWSTLDQYTRPSRRNISCSSHNIKAQGWQERMIIFQCNYSQKNGSINQIKEAQGRQNKTIFFHFPLNFFLVQTIWQNIQAKGHQERIMLLNAITVSKMWIITKEAHIIRAQRRQMRMNSFIQLLQEKKY